MKREWVRNAIGFLLALAGIVLLLVDYNVVHRFATSRAQVFEYLGGWTRMEAWALIAFGLAVVSYTYPSKLRLILGSALFALAIPLSALSTLQAGGSWSAYGEPGHVFSIEHPSNLNGFGIRLNLSPLIMVLGGLFVFRVKPDGGEEARGKG